MSKFERCVRKVKKSKSAVNPWAVCRASLKGEAMKKKTKKKTHPKKKHASKRTARKGRKTAAQKRARARQNAIAKKALETAPR